MMRMIILSSCFDDILDVYVTFMVMKILLRLTELMMMVIIMMMIMMVMVAMMLV